MQGYILPRYHTLVIRKWLDPDPGLRLEGKSPADRALWSLVVIGAPRRGYHEDPFLSKGPYSTRLTRRVVPRRVTNAKIAQPSDGGATKLGDCNCTVSFHSIQQLVCEGLGPPYDLHVDAKRSYTPITH